MEHNFFLASALAGNLQTDEKEPIGALKEK